MTEGGAIARSNNANADTTPARGLTRVEMLAHTVAGGGFVIAALTGFGAELFLDELEGWLLLIHMFGAAVFLLGMTAVAIIWADRCRFGDATGLNVGRKLVFWIALLLGFVVMLSMLAAMLPVFGYFGQHVLYEIHEICGLLFLVVMIVHTIVSLAARQARRLAK